MDFQERSQLVRRISSGILWGEIPFNSNEYIVKINDPTLSLLVESDFVYQKTHKDLKSKGDIVTLEESYKLLRDNGVWSDILEKRLEDTHKNIKVARDQLPKLKFHKLQLKATKQLIEKLEKDSIQLENTKNQLYHTTIEAFCDKSKRRFILSKSVITEDAAILNNPNFQDVLAVYYYKEKAISEQQLRELARKDPWRLFWIATKETGTPLFPQSCVEMTDYQYALVSWSRIYDFAYSSTNRPTDEIINDDYSFDAWYDQEVKRINSEISNNSIDSITSNGSAMTEVFIPCDAEGAKEIYNMNDPIARSIIQQRQQVIKEKGQIKDSDLPDMKQKMQMEFNRMAMQT